MQETFSHSKSWLYQKCRRAYSYRYKLWLKPFLKDQHVDSWKPRFVGTVIHAGMEGKLLGKDPNAFIDTAIAEEKEHGLSQEMLDELPTIESEAKLIVENFCEWLPIEDWEVVLHPLTGSPLIEFELRCTLPSGNDFLGYVDCVLRHKATGRVVVCDFKTKKKLSSEGEEDYVTQLVMYLAALKQMGICTSNTFALLEIKSATPKRAPRKIRIDTESIDGVRESADGCFKYVPKFCNDHYIARTWADFSKLTISMSRFTHEYEVPSRSSWNCKGCEFRALCDAKQYGHDIKAVVTNSFVNNPKALNVLQGE